MVVGVGWDASDALDMMAMPWSTFFIILPEQGSAAKTRRLFPPG